MFSKSAFQKCGLQTFYVKENYIIFITAGSSNKCYFVAFLCLTNES